MFHKAIDLKYRENTVLEVTFDTGEVKQYDMKVLFEKYPQFEVLNNRELFESGRLTSYGIIWNDELDLEVETIYCSGKTISHLVEYSNRLIGLALMNARADIGISQAELSRRTGVDQSDISKIERGVANPSVNTLRRLGEGLGKKLIVSFE